MGLAAIEKFFDLCVESLEDSHKNFQLDDFSHIG